MSKKILVGRVFGIGNAICTVPAIKAIRKTYPDAVIHAMIGGTSDDVGARDVLMNRTMASYIDSWRGDASYDDRYDIAVMAIPFDGRWKNGVHFFADRVMDGRGRPGHSDVFGFSSWKKHEIEYCMENAYELGYSGPIPDCSFVERTVESDPNRIYLGMGYKKDAAGFFKVKHWGTENYVELVRKLLEKRPSTTIVTTGDNLDLKLNIGPLITAVHDDRLKFVPVTSLGKAFQVVASCGTYVGNDTGMMHVAASFGLGVCVMFFMENAVTKASPWCDRKAVIDGTQARPTPDGVLKALDEVLL
jgi:hypothetical protein